MEKIQELVKKLSEANAEYRRGKPMMSDQEFDELERQLFELDPENDWFKKGMQDETPKDRKVKLPVKMMSLNKVKTIDELVEWAKQFKSNLVITPKLDGLSVGFYCGANPSTAFTRGDGETGQDCSFHFSYIGNKVMSEHIDGGLVRGEIIFTNHNFQKFKQRHPEAKNSRNSATGLINGDFDREKIVDYNNLSVICYRYAYDEELDKEEQLKLLNDHCTPECEIPYILCSVEDLQKEGIKDVLFRLFNEWRDTFPMDGLVFDVNSGQERLKAGHGANGNPNYAIAYKDPEFSEKGRVQVDHLELQLNREGVVTPVVYFTNPVNLSGADIQKVNGINMKYIHDWGIFDRHILSVVRSGEVIPKIVEVNGVKIPFRDEFKSDKEYKKAYQKALEERQAQQDYKMFKEIVDMSVWKCPFCHHELEWDENHIQMVCKNPDCDERKFQSVVQFCKIAGMKDCGEESLRSLWNAGLIHEIADLFKLQVKDFLSVMRGWGEVSIDNLLSEVKRIKSTLPFAQIAHASGMFGGLGQKTIQMIVDKVGMNDELDLIKLKSIEELCEIEGVQETTAKQFNKGLTEFYESELSNIIAFSYIQSPVLSTSGTMAGQIVCFTGFRSAELKKQIEEAGGQVVDSVTKKTTLLLVKDESEESSKTKKAKELGIPILSFSVFDIENPPSLKV